MTKVTTYLASNNARERERESDRARKRKSEEHQNPILVKQQKCELKLTVQGSHVKESRNSWQPKQSGEVARAGWSEPGRSTVNSKAPHV